MKELAEMYSEQGDDHKAVDIRLELAAYLEDEPRVELLCDVAEVLFSSIGDLESAIDMCFQALSIDSKSRRALHQLTVYYSKAKEWREAIKTILKMASLEKNADRRGRYLQAAGSFACQDDQREEAVAIFNRAVESYLADTSNPTRARENAFECFDSIVMLLTEAEDWRALEIAYRKMICRLEPGDPDVGGLWRCLGEIYRDHLGQTEDAIDSYEVASNLDTGLTNHRVLVDLYEGAGPDQLDKAISRRQFLLEAEPHNTEHYKALRGLYVRTRQMDRVWCMCRAIEALGVADSRERAFYRKNLPSKMVWPTRHLDPEMFTRISDPRADWNLSQIMGLISEVIALEVSEPETQVPFRDPHFQFLQDLFGGVSYVFGLSSLNCVIQPGNERNIRVKNIRAGAALRPTYELGRGLYEGRTVEQMVDELARSLFHARSASYLRVALQPVQLRAAFFAALSMMRPEVDVPKELESHTTHFKKVLQTRLHSAWAAQLKVAVDAFLDQGGSLDLSHWIDAVDMSARHAALLLTSSMETTLAALEKEYSGKALEEKRIQVIAKSVSQGHLSLRKDLGIVFVTS
jgi:tetratricopeptide (TPR) repeat protein